MQYFYPSKFYSPACIYDGRPSLSIFFPAVEQVLKDPVFNRDDRYFLSNDQAFDTAAKKAVHIVQTRDKLNANNAADRYFVRTYVCVCYICG